MYSHEYCQLERIYIAESSLKQTMDFKIIFNKKKRNSNFHALKAVGNINFVSVLYLVNMKLERSFSE